MSFTVHPYRLQTLLGALVLSACAVSADPHELGGGGTSNQVDARATNGAVAGAPRLPSSGGLGGGDSGGQTGSGGTGLSSNVFGPKAGASNGGGAAACDGATSGDCDWTRVEGCCKPLACERANGTDVFNTYPVESCRALIACVQAHPGCSNADDPLCFQEEDPSAPCLQQGYQASHSDADGPFAWTVMLVQCVCAY